MRAIKQDRQHGRGAEEKAQRSPAENRTSSQVVGRVGVEQIGRIAGEGRVEQNGEASIRLQLRLPLPERFWSEHFLKRKR